jgi:hypothetical protein
VELKSILAALIGAKQSVIDFERRIGQLTAEIERVEKIPPHTEDLIAWATRGLDAASASFEDRLERWYWNDASLARMPGSSFESSSPQILGISRLSPSEGRGGVTIWPLDYTLNAPDAAAITHFLRPAIEKDLPRLIAKMFPAARKGMRNADRREKLEKLRAEINQLTREREQLVKELDEARGQVNAR